MVQTCRKLAQAGMLVLGTALILTGNAGCGSGIPQTYSVKGKVLWKGGKPVEDGRIEFQSMSDPSLRATGEIDSDGSFTLTTHKDGKTRQGAIEGQHKVIVEPDVGDDEPAIVIVLPKPYTVEVRENDFKIEIEKPRRK
jgi:hypothetical protein